MRSSAISCGCSLLAAETGAARPISRTAVTMASSFCVIAYSLRGDDEMRPAVLRERHLRMARIERELFAIAHRAQALRADPERHQIRTRVDRAPFAQCQIVLGGPALVAMALDRDGPGAVALQYDRVLVEDLLRRSRQLVAVVLEEHRLERRVLVQILQRRRRDGVVAHRFGRHVI